MENITPPPVDQKSSIQNPEPIISPPKRPGFNKRLLAIPIFIFILFVLVLVISSISNSTKKKSPNVTTSPTPLVQNPNISPTQTPVLVPITPMPPRLPLPELSGMQIMTVNGGEIWLTSFTVEGPKKSLFLKTEDKIVDLSVSPDGNNVAFTFTSKDLSGDINTFPKTGLKVVKVLTKQITEYVTLEDNIAVRRPTWSGDGIYLSVWNSGKSSTLYDMTNKSSPLEIFNNPAGQIVFVPNLSTYSYIDNNALYEVDYSRNKKVKIVENINPVRSLIAGQLLPDPQMYSSDGLNIAFHNNVGQLVLYTGTKRERFFQTLAEGMPSRTSTGYYSFGDAIGFDVSKRYFVYSNIGKEVYVPGPDDNPIYIYDLVKNTSEPFFANRKESVNLGGIYVDPTKNKILFSGDGYKVYRFNGTQISNCENTVVSNDNTYAPERLWSKDGKYFISRKTYQITNTENCAISSVIDPVIPEQVVWFK